MKKNIINEYLIVKIITIFLLVREVGFFSVPLFIKIYPFSISYYIKKDICIYMGLILLYFIWAYKLKFFKKIYNCEYFKISMMWIGMIIITFFTSLMVYKNEGFLSLTKKYYFYILIITFFVLSFLFKKYKNYYCFFIKSLVYVGLLYAVLLIVYKIVFEITGNYIFDIDYQLIQMRKNTLRLARPADYLSLACVLCFSLLITSNKEKRKKWIIVFGIILVSIFWVTQTRIYELAILVSCFIGSILFMKNRTVMIYIKRWWWIGLIVVLPFIVKFIYSFFAAEDLGGTLVRFNGYFYYLRNVFKNGLIGIGFLANPENNSILTGPNLRYSLTDLGIIGFIGTYGILGISFIGLFGFQLYKSWKRALKRGRHPEVIILIVFIIITSLSVIFNDLQRAIYLPIYLSILNYCEINGNSKGELNES